MTRSTQDRGLTLVLGGTGKTGRRVIDRLDARGIPTRVGSRRASPPFDWNDEAAGIPRCAVWTPSISPTTPTSRSPGRWKACVRSPSSL